MLYFDSSFCNSDNNWKKVGFFANNFFMYLLKVSETLFVICSILS